jgi:hypothetical protein
VAGFNAVRDPALSDRAIDEVVNTPTPGVGARTAGVGAVSTSLPQASAAFGSHADVVATGSVLADRAALAGQSASQDNAGKDALIAGAAPASSIASGGNAASDAKVNLARASHSTNATQDRAADRVPERSAHFAGGAEFAISSSSNQAERVEQTNPMMLHDLAVPTQGNQSAHYPGAHAGTTSGAESFVGDTFAALDAEAASPKTTWVQAGAPRRGRLSRPDAGLGRGSSAVGRRRPARGNRARLHRGGPGVERPPRGIERVYVRASRKWNDSDASIP